jgi:hypothetical protein
VESIVRFNSLCDEHSHDLFNKFTKVAEKGNNSNVFCLVIAGLSGLGNANSLSNLPILWVVAKLETVSYKGCYLFGVPFQKCFDNGDTQRILAQCFAVTLVRNGTMY